MKYLFGNNNTSTRKKYGIKTRGFKSYTLKHMYLNNRKFLQKMTRTDINDIRGMTDHIRLVDVERYPLVLNSTTVKEYGKDSKIVLKSDKFIIGPVENQL